LLVERPRLVNQRGFATTVAAIAGQEGRAKRDAVEPTGGVVGGADRLRLAGEDQKGGLKGVLDVLLVTEDL
jgi:hypothetical protein